MSFVKILKSEYLHRLRCFKRIHDIHRGGAGKKNSSRVVRPVFRVRENFLPQRGPRDPAGAGRPGEPGIG